MIRDSTSSFNSFGNKESVLSKQSEPDTGFEEMIVERSSKLVAKSKKPKRKAFGGGEDNVESKVSIISTNSENVEKNSLVSLPTKKTFDVIPEEDHKVNETKAVVEPIHKSSVSKKKFFFDEE